MFECSWWRGRQGRRPVAAIAGVAAGLLCASLLATSVANAGVKPAAPRAAAAVPWKSVGAGWVLAEFSTGTATNRAATTLELASPAGAKYPLYTWPKSVTPRLFAWSPSKTEVLVQVASSAVPSGALFRLNLLTGQSTTIGFAGSMLSVSYTLPTGLQILADEQLDPTATTWTELVERVTKSGLPVKAIATVKHGPGDPNQMSPVYAPDGASIAVGYGGGVAVVSNAGGPVKRLPIPGVTKIIGCQVARWWNATTILAGCSDQLWLVPANGAKPTALTKYASGANFAAWHLPSGLYVNSAGACAVMVNKQNANGSFTLLHIPGLGEPRILSAAGPRLLIDSSNLNCKTGSNPGDTVAWYNPATGAKTVLFTKGVFSILPFPNVADAANGI
jgi:hypothetical protein